MKSTYPFIPSALILVTALFVFIFPLIIFVVFSVFSLLMIASLEYNQQKQDVKEQNVSGSLLLAALAIVAGFIFNEHKQLFFFLVLIGIFWLVKAGISIYFKIKPINNEEDNSEHHPEPGASMVMIDALDDIREALINIQNQQKKSEHNSKLSNDTLTNILNQLSATMTELKATNGKEFDIASDKLTEVLNTFNSITEVYMNDNLNPLRSGEEDETQNILGRLQETLQIIDAEQRDRLSGIEATIHEGSRTNKEQIEQLEGIFSNYIHSLHSTMQELVKLNDDAFKIVNTRGKDAVEIISNSFEIKKSIINAIKEAQRSIDLCVYNMSESDVMDELIKKDVTIRIIVDKSSLLSAYTGTDSIKRLQELNKRKNITIKTHSGKGKSGLMHRKELIKDSSLTLSGSANFSKNAFEFSIERLYIFNDFEYSKRHELDFDLEWKYSQPLESLLS